MFRSLKKILISQSTSISKQNLVLYLVLGIVLLFAPITLEYDPLNAVSQHGLFYDFFASVLWFVVRISGLRICINTVLSLPSKNVAADLKNHEFNGKFFNNDLISLAVLFLLMYFPYSPIFSLLEKAFNLNMKDNFLIMMLIALTRFTIFVLSYSAFDKTLKSHFKSN